MSYALSFSPPDDTISLPSFQGGSVDIFNCNRPPEERTGNPSVYLKTTSGSIFGRMTYSLFPGYLEFIPHRIEEQLAFRDTDGNDQTISTMAAMITYGMEMLDYNPWNKKVDIYDHGWNSEPFIPDAPAHYHDIIPNAIRLAETQRRSDLRKKTIKTATLA